MLKEKKHSLQVLILDADRNPISNLSYRLYFNGAMIAACTGEDGLTRKIGKLSSGDEIQIAIVRVDNSFKVIARVFADAKNKLITLISPRVKIVGPSLPHSAVTPGQVPSKKDATPPAYDPKKQKAPTEKKEFGPKIEATKNKEGNPIAKVEGDIPNLEFLDQFNGETLTDEDYLWASKKTGIEFAAIKAFAVVESTGKGFIKLWDRVVPKILYERHKFAAFTKNEFSKMNPDISLPCGYYYADNFYVLATSPYKKKRNVPDDVTYYRSLSDKDDDETKSQAALFKNLIKEGKLERSEHAYLDGMGAYKRLVKAYKLNPIAALESCSWGSFQIMGQFWKKMGYASVVEFTKSMSRSPKEQIKAFVLYIENVNPQIKKALNDLDWAAAARAYNGPSYKKNKYDIKLAAAYEEFKQEKS